MDQAGANTAFGYAEDQRQIKKLIICAIPKSKAMRETILYLNTEIFGETGSAQDDLDDSEDDAGDEVQKLLEGLALDEDDEAPPTVDIPSPPRDLTEAAPLPGASSPLDYPSRTSSADAPLATPPVPEKTGKRSKKVTSVAVSEGTLPDTAPAKKTRSKKQLL